MPIKNKPQKSPEICLIAPTQKLADKARRIINERKENIRVYSVSTDDALTEAVNIAKNLVENGTQVIISRKGTKNAIEQKFNMAVVGINAILSDYIEIMNEASKVDGMVAFFTYEKMTEDVKTMCYMLNIDARYYGFKSKADSIAVVKQAISEGAKLGIGGIMTEACAKELGLPHIVIENSEESIINAIDSAKQILFVQNQELKKQNDLKLQLERHRAVLNFTHDAIIAIDENGIVNAINPVAEKIINIKPGISEGKNIDDVLQNTKMIEVLESGKTQLNQLMNMNGTLVSTNRIPIIVDKKIKGVVATFQDIKTIQDNEKKIRLRMHEKGLVAKYNFWDIKGESTAIKRAIHTAESYAKAKATVFIHGETGTGKELFAQSIHNCSNRKNDPFVAINCAALAKNLLESELFGYVDGAFTGALKGGKSGLFELAHKGTIFLDEIGEIPIETQAQLLRVLQEKEIRRIGSGTVTPIDVRVIAATNRDLKADILKKRFREDLYYRISVLNLEIPPLRERHGDLYVLSNEFFKEQCGKDYIKYERFFNDVIHRIKEYSWNGNVRELQNFVERAYVLMSNEENNIESIDMASYLLQNEFHESNNSKQDLKQNDTNNLEEWECKKIIGALKDNDLHILKTAKSLQMSRTTLWRKIKQYNIKI